MIDWTTYKPINKQLTDLDRKYLENYSDKMFWVAIVVWATMVGLGVAVKVIGG